MLSRPCVPLIGAPLWLWPLKPTFDTMPLACLILGSCENPLCVPLNRIY
jgi:hypothetical protein